MSSFDKYAENYRSIHTQNVQGIIGKDSDFFSEYKVKEIASFIDTSKNIRILDVGCGDGNSAAYFLKYFPNCTYTGIDISKKCIQQAKMRFSSESRVTFSAYDGKIFPFEPDSFDIVFIACVLHHVNKRDHINLLTECRRVKRTEGYLIIFEHNPKNPLTIKTVNNCPFDVDAVLMSSKYLKQLVHYCAFDNINVKYTIFIPRKGILNKLARIEKYLYWLPIGGQYYITAR